MNKIVYSIVTGLTLTSLKVFGGGPSPRTLTKSYPGLQNNIPKSKPIPIPTTNHSYVSEETNYRTVFNESIEQSQDQISMSPEELEHQQKQWSAVHFQNPPKAHH